ncbi:hypothetical protein PFICI_06751 [Pestalotiopsis fici W106-1]|uniref:Rhodopsin domain-containing protein n=1 Tax=Pestalotiopsis fici (strain W106-1 / CGMCC3.15140) TaxID=1229662 RepID=W3X6V9_PESFW|nr:uncharacterized protein PFICI_06751 [Pestalotiopsis fici W106-1]ETS81749.1 hypothetical protein PFICI_06751 [Pestalotiopsis fici W106-1]
MFIQAIQWAGAGFSLVFVLIRLVSRWHGPGRIFWDDVFVVLAVLLVLITAILWQWAAKDMYYILDVQAGLASLETDYVTHLTRDLKVSMVTEIFFYAILLFVKVSFILFFKRLSSNVRGQLWIRWASLALSAICFFVSIGDMGIRCFIQSDLQYLETYCASPEFNKTSTNAITINFILDVISDIAITSIPFALLWNVRIPMRKKLAFVGIFSLSVITISAAITRVIVLNSTTKATGSPDASLVSVIVSSLSSFPQLFSASSRKVKPQWTPTETYYRRLRTRMLKRKERSTDPLYDISAISMPDFDHNADQNAASVQVPYPVLNTVEGQVAAQYSAGINSYLVPQNQMTRHFEYRTEMTARPTTTQEWPMGKD